jgi:hypothetical protein
MKKLQNNFTTPKQSKRLLELGVPVDSADCIAHIVDNGIELYEDFFLKGDVRISVINERHTYTKATTLEDGDCWLDEPYPCWSVGRLIEIMKICAKPKEQAIMVEEMLYCKDLVGLLVYMIEANKQVIDFSKLEEI